MGWCDLLEVVRSRASGAQVVVLRLYQTMNELNIILIFLVYKRRFSQHWLAGFVGISQRFGG